ncbi:hypothetical protein CRE_24857 [Caenorhabditis remanei]|uniref:Uncharacterized protein n=1 Tax=Caenorhabditis remanei TaxID=31234 RepID=E3NLB6_CAERE|nr:hypothetical protein CRE_24857 [Caenorhabditis remanei]
MWNNIQGIPFGAPNPGDPPYQGRGRRNPTERPDALNTQNVTPGAQPPTTHYPAPGAMNGENPRHVPHRSPTSSDENGLLAEGGSLSDVIPGGNESPSNNLSGPVSVSSTRAVGVDSQPGRDNNPGFGRQVEMPNPPNYGRCAVCGKVFDGPLSSRRHYDAIQSHSPGFSLWNNDPLFPEENPNNL